MEGYIETWFEITTTRFDSRTYQELESFKKRENYKGALYNVPVRMSEAVNPNKYLFVLEMNNTMNKIMGIGIIKNKAYHEKRFKNIYYDYAFNTHTYRSKFHIKIWDVDKACSLLEEFESDFIEEEFEKRLFFGKTHLKRGQCFTRFPKKWTTTRQKVFLVELFQKYGVDLQALMNN